MPVSRRTRTNLHRPISHANAICVMLAPQPGRRPDAGPPVAVRPSRRNDASMMPPIGPRPIPTEPTIDPGPPAATPVVPGPSLAPAITGGRSRTRFVAPPGGHRARARRDVLVGIGVGQVGRRARSATTPSPGTAADQEFALIREAWDTLHKQYVGPRGARRPGARLRRDQGHDRGGRRHRPHLVPDPRGARRPRRPACPARTSGSASGSSPPTDGRPLIVTVFKDSPAEKAGLEAGDDRRQRRRQGNHGPRHRRGRRLDPRRGRDDGDRHRPQRGRTATTASTAIVRADVAGAARLVDDGPGHARPRSCGLDQFSNGAADEPSTALKAIKAAGADRLVLDLRGNPGGYVNEAVGVASQFLTERRRLHRARRRRPRDPPPGLRGRRRAPTSRWSSSSTPTRPAPPRSSPARCRMPKRAEIVGVTTYGTGTVLGEFPLSDGSALRIGTVEWLTPNGRRIWHEGIVPDVVVERATRRRAAQPRRGPAASRRRRSTRSRTRSWPRRSAWWRRSPRRRGRCRRVVPPLIRQLDREVAAVGGGHRGDGLRRIRPARSAASSRGRPGSRSRRSSRPSCRRGTVACACSRADSSRFGGPVAPDVTLASSPPAWRASPEPRRSIRSAGSVSDPRTR